MNNSSTSGGGAVAGMSTWDHVEIGYSFLAALFGVPVNIYIFVKLMHSIATKRHSRLTLLSLQINIADIMILVVKCVTYSVWMIVNQWYAGDVACRLFQFFLLFPFYLSSNCRVALALDMFQSIYYPMTVRITGSRYAKIYIGAAWVLATLAASPQLVFFKAKTPEMMKGADFIQCYNTMVDGKDGFEYWGLTAYEVYHLLIVFWTPLLVITALYGAITKEGFKAFNRQMGMKMGRDNKETTRTSVVKSNSSVFSRFLGLDSKSKPQKSTSSGTSDTIVTPLLNSSTNQKSQESKSSADHKAFVNDEIQRKSMCLDMESRKDLFANSKTKRMQTRSKSLRNPSVTSPNTQQPLNPQPQKVGTAAMNMEQDAFDKARQQKRKILKFSLSIIIAYVLCWLPYQVKSMVEIMVNDDAKYFSDKYFHWLGAIMILNSCLNPFLYGFGQHSMSNAKKGTHSNTATTALP